MRVTSDRIAAGNTITVYGDTYRVVKATVKRRQGFVEVKTIDAKNRKSSLRIDLSETVDVE